MKKLAKLTLNEMQEYVALSPQEQMAMKGGVMTPYQWGQLVYTAWKIAGEVNDAIKGSGGSSTPGCPPGSIYVHQSDSTIFNNGIKTYGSQLICIPCK